MDKSGTVNNLISLLCSSHVVFALFLSHYHIAVILLPDMYYELSKPPDEEYPTINNLNIYSEEFCKKKITGPIAYITTEFDDHMLKELFIVGLNGSQSPNDRPNKYHNGPLCYGTSYTFFVRAYPISNDHVRTN